MCFFYFFIGSQKVCRGKHLAMWQVLLGAEHRFFIMRTCCREYLLVFDGAQLLVGLSQQYSLSILSQAHRATFARGGVERSTCRYRCVYITPHYNCGKVTKTYFIFLHLVAINHANCVFFYFYVFSLLQREQLFLNVVFRIKAVTTRYTNDVIYEVSIVTTTL